ncbi:MAG: hypothetical protein JRC90_01820 [Deltaproteobacteria bacterium]|nr:hypothetical protein [Deltaproteobacteria bacterium]
MDSLIRKFLGGKRNLAGIAAGVVLCGLITLLLTTNYLSQVELRKSGMEQLRYDMEKHAAAASYFFSERGNDLRNLAESRTVSAFFENRALGMSMEYGLKASLFGISSSFDRLMEKKLIAGDHIYTRIVFIDKSGELLVNSHKEKYPGNYEWKNYLTPEDTGINIIVEHYAQTLSLMESIPYFFKGGYEGQIVAWISPEVIYNNFIETAPGSSTGCVCITCNGKYIPPMAGVPAYIVNSLPDPAEILSCNAYDFEAISENGTKKEMTAIGVPIRDTPLSMILVYPSSKLPGHSISGGAFPVMVALSLVTLIIMGLLLRTNTRNLVLNTHLEEAAIREREIATKNLALREEIVKREEMATKLKKSKKAAETANRAKGDFLANMSHELRTPMNAIIGFTGLVMDKKLGSLSNKQEEYLDDVLQSSHHLLSVINDMLDISKVNAGKMVLEPSNINPEELLRNSLIMVREKAMKHRIRLSTDIGELPEIIMADERKFKQILYNLLSNAVKFTPDGGEVHLEATLKSRPAGKKFIEVSITDTGIGINRKYLERIFKPFEQVNGSLSRRYQGTGLGLSLTKSLVKLHGGTIVARSAGDSKGSSFTFTIPV